MNKNTIIITSAILVCLFIVFVGKPYFRKKTAIKTVRTVLDYWKNDDLIPAIRYWEKEKDSPPVYGLTHYAIEEKSFDKKDGMYRARIIAKLYFSPDSRFPPDREWIFKLSKTRYGWKIIDFRLFESKTP